MDMTRLLPCIALSLATVACAPTDRSAQPITTDTVAPIATLQPNQIVLPPQSAELATRCDNAIQGKSIRIDVTDDDNRVAFVHTEPKLILEGHLLSLTYSSDGCRVAVVTEKANPTSLASDNAWAHKTLWAIDLANRKIMLKQPLLTEAMQRGEVDTGTASGGRPYEMIFSISGTNIQWSPDDQKLAFASAHDGPSSDLYVFDSATNQLLRLTDGPTQIGDVHWSPDGKWIYHQAIKNFGTGAGWSVDSVWVAAVDGSANRKLIDESEQGVVFISWHTPTEIILADSTPVAPNAIRLLNIETGIQTSLFAGTYYTAQLDAKQNRLLVSDWPVNSGSAQNTPRVYRLWSVPLSGGAPTQLKQSTAGPISP